VGARLHQHIQYSGHNSKGQRDVVRVHFLISETNFSSKLSHNFEKCRLYMSSVWPSKSARAYNGQESEGWSLSESVKNEIKLKLKWLEVVWYTRFETKDDYYFNVVNANDAIGLLLILQLTSAIWAQVGEPKAAPFEPLDFLQSRGPFREVGGRGLPWFYGNSSTASPPDSPRLWWTKLCK